MRGLTSHAMHMHELEKEDLIKLKKDSEDNNMLKLIGVIGTFLITVIAVGRK
jgi:hypothetical protein